MRNKQFVWVAILVLAGTTGCAMCDNAQDGTYSAFGGKWQRDNPHSGRVASLFDPAGGPVMEQGFPSEAEPAPESMEETEESGEPLVEEPEDAEEAAELQMEEPEGGAAETALPETADDRKAGTDAQAGTNRTPASGILELPVMSEESAESQKQEDNDAGLLPPLEPPP